MKGSRFKHIHEKERKVKYSSFSRYIGSTVMTLVILYLFPTSFAYAETIYVNSSATGAGA